jgi:hypothetical protein
MDCPVLLLSEQFPEVCVCLLGFSVFYLFLLFLPGEEEEYAWEEV